MATLKVQKIKRSCDSDSRIDWAERLYRATQSVLVSYPSWEAVKAFMEGDDSLLVEERRRWPASDSLIWTTVPSGSAPQVMRIESATQGREFFLSWDKEGRLLQAELNLGGSTEAAYYILRHFIVNGGTGSSIFIHLTDEKGNDQGPMDLPKILESLGVAVIARREKELERFASPSRGDP